MTKANEVEDDNVSTWIQHDVFVYVAVQSKTMELNPSKNNTRNEGEVAIKQAIMA